MQAILYIKVLNVLPIKLTGKYRGGYSQVQGWYGKYRGDTGKYRGMYRQVQASIGAVIVKYRQV